MKDGLDLESGAGACPAGRSNGSATTAGRASVLQGGIAQQERGPLCPRRSGRLLSAEPSLADAALADPAPPSGGDMPLRTAAEAAA